MSWSPEHYACVVDILGWAGLLNEAKNFIEGQPHNLGVFVWMTLLHRDSEIEECQ